MTTPIHYRGQGTAGYEIRSSDTRFECAGHLYGAAASARALAVAIGDESQTRNIFGAEPVVYNDHQMSLQAARRNRDRKPTADAVHCDR